MLAGRKRYGLPLLGAVVAFVAASFAGPVLTLVLTFVAIGLVLDAATAWWERAGRSGALSSHRQ
jgi:hypothetical protein